MHLTTSYKLLHNLTKRGLCASVTHGRSPSLTSHFIDVEQIRTVELPSALEVPASVSAKDAFEDTFEAKLRKTLSPAQRARSQTTESHKQHRLNHGIFKRYGGHRVRACYF